MKRYILAIAVLGLAVVASSYALTEGHLELVIRSERTSYSLGEPIQFDFEIKNTSNKNIVILNGLGHLDGYLSVWISKEGKPFEKYDHTKWGIMDSSKITTVRPNESVINKALIFWNNKPKFSNSVASDIAERASVGRIMTDYAFPEAGTYYVKASYSIFEADQAEAMRIESPPVKINITEPTGDDLKVWNIIKDRGEFAYFIQESEFPISSHKTRERTEFEEEIQQIVDRYPNSLIVNQMERSLQRFRASEEKIRKASQQFKTNIQNKP